MSISKKSGHSMSVEKVPNKELFHSKLTDVGLYCLGGLCAVSLSQLFEEENQKVFKKKAIEKILLNLGQPKQTNESMYALLDGEVMSDCNAFVDSLMEEECLKEGRQPLVAELIGVAIKDGCYDARMRVLIKHIAWQLRVTWDDLEAIEEELAETLEYDTYVMSEQELKEKAKKVRNRKIKRYALIGLATVGGGALIGLTGGLAAPLVAAGAGAVIGGAGAAALGSAAGVAIIGSLFGVAGAGLTGYKMKRRVGAIDEFSFEPLTLIGSKLDIHRTVKQLHITIAVTGWINDKIQDFRKPWSALAESKEQYSLRWESKYLYQMGEAFDYLLQTGLNVATTEALKYTILSGIIAAVAWPAALISAAGAIDNPWHVCTQRAVEAGKQLAEVLLAREQGNRPVTLIGFSLGARVIFSCLEELTKRTGAEGLIEDVILLGAPISGDPKHWQQLTKVVAGKIVNGYARGDWLLKFLYRTASVTFRVAGLSPVKWENRRMHNIDLSDVIDGHGDYIKKLDTVMKAVGVRTKDELNLSNLKLGKSASSEKEEVCLKGHDDIENETGTKTMNNNTEPSSGTLKNGSKSEMVNENKATNDTDTYKDESKSRPVETVKHDDIPENQHNKDSPGGALALVKETEAKVDQPSALETQETTDAIKDESAIPDEKSEKKTNIQSLQANSSSTHEKQVPCVDIKPENAVVSNKAEKTDVLVDQTGDRLSPKGSNEDKSDSTGIVCELADEISGFENIDKSTPYSKDEDSEGCYFTDSDPEPEGK